ncbi:MAG: hypothetical protein ACTSXV_02250 [Alphaproteobacteria bacterium]
MKKTLIVLSLILFPFVSFAQMPGMEVAFEEAQVAALQSEIQKIKNENANLEKDNKELEEEIAKFKKQKGWLIAGTAAGVAGTGVGTAFWVKNSNSKKELTEYTDTVKKINAKIDARTDSLPLECTSLQTISPTQTELNACLSVL